MKLNEAKEKAVKAMCKIVGGSKTAQSVTVEEWLSLKQALGNINNIITLTLAQKFAEELCSKGVIVEAARDRIIDDLNKKSVNANGYDIQYDGDVKILAEVKANIPIHEGQYGAKQVEGIKKDLDGLIHGKAKGAGVEVKDYLRFMVILDVPGAKEAMKKIVHEPCADVVIIDPITPASIDMDKVNVVFIPL